MAYHSIDFTFTYFIKNTDYLKCLAIAKVRFLEELRQAGMRVKPACVARLFKDKNERIKIFEATEGED